jgi:hypothetical protein
MKWLIAGGMAVTLGACASTSQVRDQKVQNPTHQITREVVRTETKTVVRIRIVRIPIYRKIRVEVPGQVRIRPVPYLVYKTLQTPPLAADALKTCQAKSRRGDCRSDPSCQWIPSFKQPHWRKVYPMCLPKVVVDAITEPKQNR